VRAAAPAALSLPVDRDGVADLDALTACSDPSDSGTGTPKDTATNTSGNSPSDESQGNLPDNSNPEPSSGSTGSG
jgi:hypothetical protein